MVALGEKAGFQVEGTLRSYTLERGERRDLLMLSLLPGELR
jgi:RimJ/RimL family protein N-acetyltransferase